VGAKLYLEELGARVVPSTGSGEPAGTDPAAFGDNAADAGVPQLHFAPATGIPAGSTLKMTVVVRLRDGSEQGVLVAAPGGKTAAELAALFQATLEGEGFVTTKSGGDLTINSLKIRTPGGPDVYSPVEGATVVITDGGGLGNPGQYLPTVTQLTKAPPDPPPDGG
jgi:hypothetical protein